jgi:hypothetical protein
MERTGADFPVLIAQTGLLNGQRWLIDRPMTLGRDSTCDVVIADRQVSRFHARISQMEENVLLEDLGSKNGTFWNSKPVEEPVVLEDGDLVQVALVQQFVFLSSDATVPLGEVSFPSHDRSGRLYLDSRSRRVWIGQKEITPPLSMPQYRLLKMLYEQPGQVVPRNDLINSVWSEEESQGVSEQALDALVRRLRDRLATLDPVHTYLVTIRGHGLRLDNPSE